MNNAVNLINLPPAPKGVADVAPVAVERSNAPDSAPPFEKELSSASERAPEKEVEARGQSASQKQEQKPNPEPANDRGVSEASSGDDTQPEEIAAPQEENVPQVKTQQESEPAEDPIAAALESDSPLDAFFALLQELKDQLGIDTTTDTGATPEQQEATTSLNTFGIQISSLLVEQRIIRLESFASRIGTSELSGLSFIRQHLAALRQLAHLAHAAISAGQEIDFTNENISNFLGTLQEASGVSEEDFAALLGKLSNAAGKSEVKSYFSSFISYTEVEVTTTEVKIPTASAKWLLNTLNEAGDQRLGEGLEKAVSRLQELAARFASGATPDENAKPLPETAKNALAEAGQKALDAVNKALAAQKPIQQQGLQPSVVSTQPTVAAPVTTNADTNTADSKLPDPASNVNTVNLKLVASNPEGGESDSSQTSDDDGAAGQLPLPLQNGSANRGNVEQASFSKVMENVQNSAADQALAQVKMMVKQGTSRVQIQLHPAELGKLDIRMEIKPEGTARLHFTVDNVRALELLRNDVRAMERMLMDVGLKADSGSLTFDLRGENQSGQSQQQGGGDGTQPNIPTTEQIEDEMADAVIQHYQVESDGLDIRI